MLALSCAVSITVCREQIRSPHTEHVFRLFLVSCKVNINISICYERERGVRTYRQETVSLIECDTYRINIIAMTQNKRKLLFDTQQKYSKTNIKKYLLVLNELTYVYVIDLIFI